MAMWDVKKTMSLIEDFHRTPCLWDMQCVDYKNRTKKFDAYELLSKEYGVPPSEIEKKIQALKNQFRREHRKIQHCRYSGSSSKKSQWYGYQSLMFLQHQYECRGSRSIDDDGEIESLDIKKETSLPERSVDYCGESEEIADDQSSTSSGLAVAEKESDFRPPPPPAKKFKRSFDYPSVQDAYKCMKVLTENLSNRDEFTVYGEHIANKLRLSGRSRMEIAIAEHHIDDICFKLTMGEFSELTFTNYLQHDVSSLLQQNYSFSPNSSPSTTSHYTPKNSPPLSVSPVHLSDQCNSQPINKIVVEPQTSITRN
ncbi:uncharacterized protein LOC142320273 [Lycorma delicatula]|uniref:uncharacterized protein LOC142320273 n=1 Tax=Lycorma delicatula TaxID=130591 RepID=UPI003F511581